MTPERCQFFIERRQRSCALPTTAAARFCGAHQLHRPSCPLCGTRLRDAAAVSAHALRRCPVAKRRAATLVSPWYAQNANLPPPEAAVDACVAHLRIGDPPGLTPLTPRAAPPPLPEEDTVRRQWSNARESAYRMEERHFEQGAALCALGLPDGNTVDVVVELGAGRAYTALYAAHVLRERAVRAAVVVVDRGSPRMKADRRLRAWETDGVIAGFRRVRLDLTHLCVAALPFVDAGAAVLVVGKHLCGDATDLALRACVRFAKERNVRVKLVLAPCCRTLCSGATYTGLWWRRNASLDRFEQLATKAAWGLDAKHTAEQAEIGYRSRVLIDSSRVLWLREQGWEAHLYKYTDQTPEHLCIVATFDNKQTQQSST